MSEVLIPRCDECEAPLHPTEPGCLHSEKKLREMGVERFESLARRLAYFEGMVKILTLREVKRIHNAKPRAQKRAERAAS